MAITGYEATPTPETQPTWNIEDYEVVPAVNGGYLVINSHEELARIIPTEDGSLLFFHADQDIAEGEVAVWNDGGKRVASIEYFGRPDYWEKDEFALEAKKEHFSRAFKAMFEIAAKLYGDIDAAEIVHSGGLPTEVALETGPPSGWRQTIIGWNHRNRPIGLIHTDVAADWVHKGRAVDINYIAPMRVIQGSLGAASLAEVAQVTPVPESELTIVQ